MDKFNITIKEELVIDEFMSNLRSNIIPVQNCKESLDYMRTYGEFGVSKLIRSNLKYIMEKYTLTRNQINSVIENAPLT